MYTWQNSAGVAKDMFNTEELHVGWHLQVAYLRIVFNRTVSQSPQCIKQISHNAPFCNKNMHVSILMFYEKGWYDIANLKQDITVKLERTSFR